jgi:hypothetical protein
MKSTTDVYGVVMFGGNVNETPSLIEIWISENGTGWTSMGTYSVKRGTEYQYFEFADPQQTQHIKVECKASSGGNSKNVSIYELGAYTR